VPDALWFLPERVHAAAKQIDPLMTQDGSAERSGLSQTFISRLLGFERLEGMKIETVLKLAVGLGVSVDTLLGMPARPALTQEEAAAARERNAETLNRIL
jgi:transcriptional regulator with XRE-family HTH domain